MANWICALIGGGGGGGEEGKEAGTIDIREWKLYRWLVKKGREAGTQGAEAGEIGRY